VDDRLKCDKDHSQELGSDGAVFNSNTNGQETHKLGNGEYTAG